MTHWLLREDTLAELRGRFAQRSAKGDQPDLLAAHAAQSAVTARRDEGLECLVMAGSQAEIRVEGVLVPEWDIWLWFFGYEQTSYADLQEAIAQCRSADDITDVSFVVDSPGGQVDGLFETLAAIEHLTSEKQVTVKGNNAFSAAYAIAAVAGPIEAQTQASSFGSIGVAASYLLSDDVIDLTNTESPEKRPDLKTEEGRASVVAYLDQLFDLFAEAIAKGRGTTRDSVAKNYGRGASMIAREAQRLGLIDSIAQPELRVVRTPEQASTATENDMDLKKLKTEHPGVYEAAVEQGVAQERDRVCAHLELGKTSGALETAHSAIQDGSAMTQTLTAKYLAAGMNRADRETRQAETDNAATAVEGAAPDPASAKDAEADAIVAALEDRLGKKKG